MKARIEDLQKDDVVLIAANGSLYEAKLLRQPKKVTRGKTTTWRGSQKWTSVVCAVREESFTYHYVGSTRAYTQVKMVIANGDYNKEKRIDFTERECWLLKRDGKDVSRN